MVNFESKAGEIKSSEIDLSKIYATKQNALEGLNNVKISENNASWKSDDLTYKILDDNQTVVISNGGVPIGFTTVEALKGVAEGEKTNGAIVPGEELIVDQTSYQENMDDTIEDTGSSIPAEEAPAMEIQPEYNEEPAEEVEQGQDDSVIVPGEEAPTQNIEVEAEVQDEVVEEITAETQQPPEPPVTAESIEAEVDDSAAQEIVAGTAQPSDFNFKFADSNTIAAMAKNMGFTDDQVKLAVGISRFETGNYEKLCGGYNYGGLKCQGDVGISSDGYALYSSPEVGMTAFLKNLKKNYLDLGLTTPETIYRKYLGYDDGGFWASQVYGCMS